MSNQNVISAIHNDESDQYLKCGQMVPQSDPSGHICPKDATSKVIIKEEVGYLTDGSYVTSSDLQLSPEMAQSPSMSKDASILLSVDPRALQESEMTEGEADYYEQGSSMGHMKLF